MSEQPKLRRTDAEYKLTRNTVYDGGPGQRGIYCWGHKSHRETLGGRIQGKLRLWYCAECVAARAALKKEKTS